MSLKDIKQRLLSVARDRLRNRPKSYRKLESEILDEVAGLLTRTFDSWDMKLTLLQTEPLSISAVAAGRVRREEWLDEKLLRLVDEWAEKNPEPTITPLPPQSGIPEKELGGYVSEYVNVDIPELESAGVAVLIGGDFPEVPRLATPAEMEQLELIWQKAGCGPFDERASRAERKEYADVAKAEGVEIQFVHAGIRVGVESERAQKTPTFGVLQMQPPKSADYLATLHQWNALPEIVPIPDLAELLAVLCKQNKAALLKIIESVIWSGEIPFWGLSHNGGWIKDMVRVWADSKPHYKLPTEQRGLEFSIHVKNEIKQGVDKLHVEAMGVRPADFVSLLEKRGRKVPDELKVFLPDQTEPQQSTPTAIDEMPTTNQAKRTRQRDQEKAIVEGLKQLMYDPLELPLFNAKVKPDVKTECWEQIRTSPLFDNFDIFDKAWGRASKNGDIKRCR